MLEGKAKDTGASVLQKKFLSDLQEKKSSKTLLLVLELRSSGFYVQAYVDDLAVLLTGADMFWIRSMAQNWASEQELQISSKKTETVLSLTNGFQIWVPCQGMVQNLNFPRNQSC